MKEMEEMRELAMKMIIGGIEAADPRALVRDSIEVHDDVIKICGKEFERSDHDEIVVLGIGKASVPMAMGCEILKPDDGLVITKSGEDHHENCPVEVMEAHHPYPEDANKMAADELLSKVDGKENALFVFLVSGGGSALFSSPVEGITAEDMNALNKLLVNSGANIQEMNAVRKHVSRVKGGRFGELCSKNGDIVSLIISDVVGDDLSSVPSGPPYPDETTFHDAKIILKEYDIWDAIPSSVREHIEAGIEGRMEETPTELKAHNFLIGNNLLALEEAKRLAKRKDMRTLILTSQNKGEAREVAKPLTAMAMEVQDSHNPIEPPAALVLGGETTVRFDPKDEKSGKGGPNRELVLSAALEIDDRENIVVASVDSDGIDGTDKSGAIADTSTIENCDLDAKEYLDRHDSQPFFEALGDSVEFESSTNVNDITVILVGEDVGN